MNTKTLAGALAGAIVGALVTVSVLNNPVAAQSDVSALPQIPDAQVGCDAQRTTCTFKYPDGVRCMTTYSSATAATAVAVSCTNSSRS